MNLQEMNRWIAMLSSVFTCIIVVSVRFQDERDIKLFPNKYLHILLHNGCVIGVMLVNIWLPPVMILCMNVLTLGLISCACLCGSNAHKQQLRMLEQQGERQSEKYAEAMSILHDINKHITIIENLCQNDQKSMALSYTKQINELLRPLSPYHYVNNLVLDCLLQDVAKLAERHHIAFHVDVSTADIHFMRPVDITTLFGNLLENAINACRKCKQDAYISFSMHAYNEMISIRVENRTASQVSVRNGRISKALWDIGLLNIQRCIETYKGSIFYSSQNDVLICDILLNREEV